MRTTEVCEVTAERSKTQRSGRPALKRPSYGGFVPAAETTLICDTGSKKSLTTNVRLDNKPNPIDRGRACRRGALSTQVYR
jgi:hypothetical protein